MGYVNGSKLRGGTAYRQKSYVKEYIKDRDNRTCQLCGATEAEGARLEADHIIPWSVSHDSTLSNYRTLCTHCNRYTRRNYKRALPEEEYNQWLMRELS